MSSLIKAKGAALSCTHVLPFKPKQYAEVGRKSCKFVYAQYTKAKHMYIHMCYTIIQKYTYSTKYILLILLIPAFMLLSCLLSRGSAG